MVGLFGEGEGAVHGYNIVCQGNETNLLNCSHLKVPVNVINPHVADAGVRCFNLTGEYNLTVYTQSELHTIHTQSQLHTIHTHRHTYTHIHTITIALYM